MGFVLLAMTVGFAMEGPNVIWSDASQVNDKGLNVPKAATYTIWAWTQENEPVEVVLDGKSLKADPPKEPKDRYAWRKLGEATLQAGATKPKVDPKVATLVLTTDAQYDPAKAMVNIRAWDRPEPPRDLRMTDYRDTNTFATFPQFTREAWNAHAAMIRRRMLVGSGLLPLPERTPLNAKVTDPIEHDDYIVEKVSFEARPGFLVTGNLYRPKGNGPFPAIVNPHGHWEKGRLEDTDKCSVPARCITFARMGIVAFSYDMVGTLDSQQCPHGFMTPPEKLWGIHAFAFQLWDSMRAVDFVQGLPYVDKDRIGCTGASGGGTQTFALYTVDDRVKVAAPVNMISSTMQGGCPCENAPVIRYDGVSNMDIGAMMAPRPLLMVCATGDWTRETPRIEYPAVKSVYALYGAPDHVESEQFDFDHNYNKSSREAVYRFMGKWLLNQGEKYKGFTEPPYTKDPDEKLRVNPKLEDYPKREEIVAKTIAANRAKWAAVMPKDKAAVESFRKEYAVALNDVLDASVPQANDLTVRRQDRTGRVITGDLVTEHPVVGRKTVGDAVPGILWRKADGAVRDAVLIVHGQGKAALADVGSTKPGELVQKLLDQGKCVMAIDAFLLGDHQSPFGPVKRATGGFPDTFEPTDTACRVQDVLTALAYLRSRRDLSGKIDLVGLGEGGMWCLFASALDGKVERTVVDANQFGNEDDQAWVDKFYVPCIRSVGDVATAAVLIAPRKLYVGNTGDAFKTDAMAKAWTATGTSPFPVDPGTVTTAVVLEQLKAS